MIVWNSTHSIWPIFELFSSTKGTSKHYDDSDDDCTPSNSYHNSSESNSSSASYNSLHNVHTESASHGKQVSLKASSAKSSKEPSYENFKNENLELEQVETILYEQKQRHRQRDEDDYETTRAQTNSAEVVSFSHSFLI